MVWLNVKNDSLESFQFSQYGMDRRAEVTQNRKVQVSEEVAEELLENHPDDFERDEDGDEEPDDGDEDEGEEDDAEADDEEAAVVRVDREEDYAEETNE